MVNYSYGKLNLPAYLTKYHAVKDQRITASFKKLTEPHVPPG